MNRSTYAERPEWRSHPMTFHKESITVASCQTNKCGIKRIPLTGRPVLCPNCNHALFYERVPRSRAPHWGKGGMNYVGHY